MKLIEAMQKVEPRYGTTFYADIEDDSKKSNSKIENWIELLKKGDPNAITYAVNKVPRIEINYLLDKLKRTKYKKYPGTEVAISKLKWRRGF